MPSRKKPRRSQARARPPQRPARARPQPRPQGRKVPPPVVSVELGGGAIEERLRKLAQELRGWVRKGRYSKVRFKLRGKQLLPDLPLAAVLAAEGLTFYWAGLLRALVVNVAGGSLLEVEVINDSEHELQRGRERLLAGDLDGALAHFRKAVSIAPSSAEAQLRLGVTLKLHGDRDAALAALQKARALDPEGKSGREAAQALEGLGSNAAATAGR